MIDSGIQPPVILGQLRAATIRCAAIAREERPRSGVPHRPAIKSSVRTPQYARVARRRLCVGN
jgi:hypothetical protein